MQAVYSSPLTGPSLPPLSGKAEQILVLLHGYGADGEDMIDLGANFREILPQAAILAPHAPHPCALSPMGREWFPLSSHTFQELWEGVERASPVLHTFLESQLQYWGLPDSQLVLLGFSQGGMLALHAGLQRPRALAGIISFSGVFVAPSKSISPEQVARPRPPVLLIHGDQDEVIPPHALPQSLQQLEACGVKAESYLARGVGHSIDPKGLTTAKEFLKKIFGRSGGI